MREHFYCSHLLHFYVEFVCWTTTMFLNQCDRLVIESFLYCTKKISGIILEFCVLLVIWSVSDLVSLFLVCISFKPEQNAVF